MSDSIDFNDIDTVIEALDDKIVRTSQGSFISVDDLKQFHGQVREQRVTERASAPRPKSFAAARKMALEDERFTRESTPRAPALAGVKGVNVPEAPTQEA